MKKIKVGDIIGKVNVRKTGKQPWFTIRFINFNPKKMFVGTPEAKDIFRKQMHCSKQKMKDEYDSVYATLIKIGRGKNKHVEFQITTKNAADTIFIVPKKYRKEAYKYIVNELVLPYEGLFK